MKWIETTLRKGTKIPKICRDMFITDSRGTFRLVKVKNGKISERKEITIGEASKLQRKHKLISTACEIFNGCYSYRTIESTMLVNTLILTNTTTK